MQTQQPLTDTLLRIRAGRAALAPAEQRIADHILADAAGAVGQTISEPAAACNTSETTVVRFSRAVGRRGYPDLRVGLATGLAHEAARDRPVPGTDIGPDGTLRDLVDKIGYADARGVEDTIENLDLDRLEQFVAVITTARRINLLGVGASGFTACDLQRGLHRIGLPVAVFEDFHEAPAAAGLVGTATCTSGCPTRGPRPRPSGSSAWLAAADAVLTTVVRESGLRSGAMADRVARLAIVRCVLIAVAQRTPHQTEAAPRATFDAVRDLRMEGQPRR